jgi:hypothetical protein
MSGVAVIIVIVLYLINFMTFNPDPEPFGAPEVELNPVIYFLYISLVVLAFSTGLYFSGVFDPLIKKFKKVFNK